MSAIETTQRPKALSFRAHNIPQAIKDLDQWVLWRYDSVPDKKGGTKWSKVPYTPWGQRASCNNPSTWMPFEQVYQAYRQGGFDGCSLALAPGDGLVGIDLDKCINDASLTPDAEQIVNSFATTYVEYSPSGKGIRAFCYGVPGRTGKGGEGNWIEVYDHTSPRFLTVTGHTFFERSNQIDGVQDALDFIHEKFMFDKEPEQPARSPQPVDLDDRELLDKARDASNGDKFRRLYDHGDTSDYSGDHSSADMALCKMLAFWTGCDYNRMDRLFRASGLYRKKWDRADYREGTLSKAISQCSEMYEPGKPQSVAVVPSESRDIPTGREDWQKDIERLGANDEGNARTVDLLYGGQFCYTDTYGWLHYNGRYWRTAGAEAKLERAIVASLKKKQGIAVKAEDQMSVKAAVPSAGNVRAAKFLFRSMVTRQIEEFDKDPDFLNVANGVVHLPTGELTPHAPEQSFTYCLQTAYHPEKTAEDWKKFLSDIVEAPEMVEYLQRCIGYSLTGHCSEEVLWYIQGPTRSGKGTFTETLQQLMDQPLCAEVQFGTFTRDRDNDANNFDLAPLKPCRLIFASESKKNQRLNAPAVKWLTGGNRIRCSFKRKDHFEYTPQYKFWLTSNYPVNADVDDHALWGRIRYLRFPRSRLGEEDKGLKARMKSPDNLERVLSWAIEGAKRWYQTRGQGLATPDIVKELTQAVRDEQDIIKQWLTERIVVSESTGAYITNATLYHSYKNWCEENGATPRKTTSLTQALNSKGIVGPKVKRVGIENKPTRIWLGLDLVQNLVSDENKERDKLF